MPDPFASLLQGHVSPFATITTATMWSSSPRASPSAITTSVGMRRECAHMTLNICAGGCAWRRWCPPGFVCLTSLALCFKPCSSHLRSRPPLSCTRECIENALALKSACPICALPAWQNELRKNTQIAAVVQSYRNLRALAYGEPREDTSSVRPQQAQRPAQKVRAGLVRMAWPRS